MKNNYLLESMDGIVISDEIDKIIKQEDFIDATKSIYDLDEKELDDAFEDLDTYNFLSPKKVVIIKNIFSNTNEKKMNHLLKYLENYSSDNLLILTCPKLNNKLTIVKNIKKNKNITIKKLEIEPSKYIKNLLHNYNINPDALNLLISMCKDDITRINSECNKLMIYKIDTLEITRDNVQNLVVKKLGDSSDTLFSFIKYLLLKDKKNALSEYQQLLEYNIDSSSIIGLLTSQLRLIYQVKILSERNLSNDQITDKLSLKSSYQIKKMREYSYHYTYQELSSLIDSIAKLDLNIKSGKTESNLAIDMLLINL